MATLVELVFSADETKDLCQEIAAVGSFLIKSVSGGVSAVSDPSDDPADGIPVGTQSEAMLIVVGSTDTLYLKNQSNSTSCTVRVYHNR